MKNIQSILKARSLVLATALILLVSCNKDLPEGVPIITPPPAGSSIMALLDGPNYTFLKAAVTRAGLSAPLSDVSAVFTVFAPTDAAFIASGIPSVAVINTLAVPTLSAIVRYHVIGGQRFEAAAISEKYPNMYLQSLFVLSAPSAASPPGYRMPLGISRRGSNAWANNIPVTQANIQAANGVIHNIAALLSPPSLVIAQVVGSDPSYSYLLAAVQRADQGPPPGAPALLPILSNPAANLTVFAPTNDAFNTLFAALGVPQNPSSFALLPSATVWGIVAFHVQGVRAFSVNLSNTSRPSIMGVLQQFDVTSGVKVRGPGNIAPTPGGPVNFFANVTLANINSINGVVHRIDAVLMPQ